MIALSLASSSYAQTNAAPATIFEAINFGGKSQALVEGMNVGPLALGNDVASSVKVSQCFKVTLYGAGPGQNGPELVLRADDASLIDDNFNDILSNVLVERVPNCDAAPGNPVVSLQSANYRDRYVRHRNYQGYLEPVGSDLDRKDSSFRRVAGLADRTQVSFEATNFPGWFLAADGDKAMLRQRPSGNQGFDRDATFVIRGGLADAAGMSLESLAQSGKYLRHYQFGLFIQAPDGTKIFQQDATFFQVAPNCGTQCAP